MPNEAYIVPFPQREIENIVRAVDRELEVGSTLGTSGDRDENGAQEVMRRIADRVVPEHLGIRSPGDPPQARSPRMTFSEEETRQAYDWAAKEYFKILLADLRRSTSIRVFHDHRNCAPDP